jgi:hypothetical protein
MHYQTESSALCGKNALLYSMQQPRSICDFIPQRIILMHETAAISLNKKVKSLYTANLQYWIRIGDRTVTGAGKRSRAD